MDDQAKIIAVFLIAGTVLLFAILSGSNNTEYTGQVTKTPSKQSDIARDIQTLTVNPCIGGGITLFSSPGDFTSESYSTGRIPDCQSITVEVLDRKCSSNGIEFDLIRYGNLQGWVTRRLLTCPASKNLEGCDAAVDTICEA